MSGRPLLKHAEKFELRQLREAGVPVKLCASYMNVSVATAMRVLAELRERMGPEKLPPRKRHLARFHADTSPRATRQSE